MSVIPPVQFGRQRSFDAAMSTGVLTLNAPNAFTQPALAPTSTNTPQPDFWQQTATAGWKAMTFPVRHPFQFVEALALLELSIGRIKSMEHLPGAAKTAYNASKKVLFKS